jgi:membrane associated rhomboid family serine protease
VPSDRLPKILVTPVLTVVMVVIHLAKPPITPLTYTVLAPWIHADWTHIVQNLFIFVVLGTWVENRIDWLTYLFAALMIPYLALYLPVVLGYGGLSRGASGLTMVLTGYVIPVLLVDLGNQVDSLELEVRQVAVWLGMFILVTYLAVDSWLTIHRFIELTPRPDGVSVSSHLTGLILGILWFCWRAWRHGLSNA